MSNIKTMIVAVAGFRTQLVSYLDPRSVRSLRVALGHAPLTSAVETFKFVSVHALLGINLEWVRKMNTMGYSVVLLGKDLDELSGWLSTPGRVGTVGPIRDLMRFMLFCVSVDGDRDGYPDSAWDPEEAILPRMVHRPVNGGTFKSVTDTRNGIRFEILMTRPTRAGSPYSSPFVPKHWFNSLFRNSLDVTTTTMSAYSTRYTWVDFVRFPNDPGMIRGATSRYTIATGAGEIRLENSTWFTASYPDDYTIYDDDDSAYISFPSFNKLTGSTDAHLPTMITLWPPNKSSFWCESGEYSTEVDPDTRRWVLLDQV